MNIPFTVNQFFDVFRIYNTAIWPIHIVAYLLGIIALVLAIRPFRFSSQIIAGILATFWIWMGVFYHIIYFSSINPVAKIFGFFYILQGILFVIIGIVFRKLSFRLSFNFNSIIGAIFILYAMVFYSLLGLSFGHSYPYAPMYGVAPCPTTIFTFGLLLWTTAVVPSYLLIIPLIWSIIGMSAAISLNVPQDYGLAIAGVAGTILVFIKSRKQN